ncbi:MAG TPA: hypothetical protein ENK18_16785 [Deltaproteobacteria bacterium]|nr:hypothetical protein [Deltaproteobacteria bacterium]
MSVFHRSLSPGRKVSPALLAALLVERGLADPANEIEQGDAEQLAASVGRQRGTLLALRPGAVGKDRGMCKPDNAASSE